ncbi:ATP-binding cassette domain-containing protein [Paenibacillus sp. NPDC058071]|uniref:ATP-binding cassette domain-containing protein n=1 Tax=Paenibacillus sp. NPDC058071 TaxID=3346326 RepID=UPI0036D76E56
MKSILLEMEKTSVRAESDRMDDSEAPFLLRDVDFRIEAAEWVSVIGMNGSGKSTFAKLAAGFRVGRVTGSIVRGETIREGLSPIVMQQPEASMVGSTPLEDVVMLLEQHGAPGEQIVERAERVLEQSGMGDRLHQPVGTLSGGQKQLTAIAGATAVLPHLLIMDEATSMLDPEASKAVIDSARRLHRSGAAVMWVTQRLEELNRMDRLIVLREGRIAFDGKAERFYERNSLNEEGSSVCERLGFEPSYTIRVSWELQRLGCLTGPIPFTAEELAEAVRR